MKLTHANAIACWLVDQLRPACGRIEIAGSVRRKKPEVKDIEIVAMPDLTPPRVEFGQKKIFRTQLDAVLNQLFEDKHIGFEMSGDKFKKLNLYRPGDWNPLIQVDLFLCTPPSQWGVLYTIRTGPAALENNFSKWVVTQKHKGGGLPDGHFVKHNVVWIESQIGEEDVPRDPVKAAKVMNDQNHVPMPEEIDFLNFLGLGWIDPDKRLVKRFVPPLKVGA